MSVDRDWMFHRAENFFNEVYGENHIAVWRKYADNNGVKCCDWLSFDGVDGRQRISDYGYDDVDAYRKAKIIAANFFNAPAALLNVSFRHDRDSLQVAFVDDVTADCPAHCLVETSPGNFQAHFLLHREWDLDAITNIQKQLCKQYDGDRAATSADKYRRHPRSSLSVRLQARPPLLIRPDSSFDFHFEKKEPRTRKHFIVDLDKLHEYYESRYEMTGNESDAEFSVMLLLFSNGVSRETVETVVRSLPHANRRRDYEAYLWYSLKKAKSIAKHGSWR